MPTVSALHSYPIKSCRGLDLRSGTVDEAGLELDRLWMIVDEQDEFLSQRECPKLALVTTEVKFGNLRVRAPGMVGFELPIDIEEDETSVVRKARVWNDAVDAVDEGDYIAHWLGAFLGRPARLMKLHPDAKRLVNPRRTGGIEMRQRFADSYPLLVVSEASLADLNRRLVEKGVREVPMNRFRPNIVLAGIEAYEEDHIDEIRLGEVVLKAVKRCVRCEIPCTDQETAEVSPEPMATLSAYRADPRLDGGVTFGTHFIVTSGAGGRIEAGQSAEVALRI